MLYMFRAFVSLLSGQSSLMHCGQKTKFVNVKTDDT
jgi:hypothetical protein